MKWKDCRKLVEHDHPEIPDDAEVLAYADGRPVLCGVSGRPVLYERGYSVDDRWFDVCALYRELYSTVREVPPDVAFKARQVCGET